MSILNHLDEIRSILEIYVRFKTHSGVPKEQVQDMKDILSILDSIEKEIDEKETEDWEEEWGHFEPSRIGTKTFEVTLHSLDDVLKFEHLMSEMKNKTLYQIIGK